MSFIYVCNDWWKESLKFVMQLLHVGCLKVADMHFKLALSTVANTTVVDMRCTSKKLFVENNINDTASGPGINTACTKIASTCDADSSGAEYSNYQLGKGAPNTQNSRCANKGGFRGNQLKNPPKRYGTILLCAICGLKFWV